jgi:ATP-dependent RNA helicase DDX35
MTSIQVCGSLAKGDSSANLLNNSKDIFIISDGAPGALAELERRKFTAEEGVRISQPASTVWTNQPYQDHLTLLNGIFFHCAHMLKANSSLVEAYNAFTRYGRSSSWCKSHALSFRAMSRAVSIRSQLKKYMQRFSLPLESCEGDEKRLRRCLVSGYWRNGARWVADGTYRSVRGNKVYLVIYCGKGCLMALPIDLTCSPHVCSVHAEASIWLGCFP